MYILMNTWSSGDRMSSLHDDECVVGGSIVRVVMPMYNKPYAIVFFLCVFSNCKCVKFLKTKQNYIS